MKENDVVLFVPWGVYACEQQLAMALYLTSKSNLRPHFLLISEYDRQFIPQLEAAGIPFNTLYTNGEGGGATANVGGVLKAFRWWKELWQRKQITKSLVRELVPRCTLVSQERLVNTLPIMKALRELRVPVILMPDAPAPPDGSAQPRRESYLLKAGLNNVAALPEKSSGRPGTAMLNRLVQRWLPCQVYESRWGKMLFYPAAQTFLLKLMGILPRNPWYQGASFADHIMVSGSDEAAMYAEAKVDPGKLLYYGSHEFDVLFDRWFRRTELRLKTIDAERLDPGKSILIVALPRLWEQNLTSKEVHWQSINKILEVLSRQDCNVMVSLHPHCDRSQYDWIEDKYPVKICESPLKDVLPVADVYVAAYSSTIRWAVALGIPVINLDFWGLRYEDYLTPTGYQTATTIAEFDDLVAKTPASADIHRPAKGSSPADGGRDFLVDGQAKGRLMSFIQSLDLKHQQSAVSGRFPPTTEVGGR